MRQLLNLLIIGFLMGGCLAAEKSVSNVDSSDFEQRSGNASPTITGNPQPAIMFGELYEFEPRSADPDGDRLAFQIENRPSWASFDASSGRLFGQPLLGDVGVYDNIVITVSDGTASRSLRAFSITVSQLPLGSVTLNWVAPTQNTDGTALLDLAGYKVYFGKNSGEYDHEIHINNAGLTTYVVDNLVVGTYYFSATAVNESGVESEYSDEAAKTVN